ncbi:four helix bundle protein [Allorhodopirellula solitaria]|uniref:four helix bundle protein n=1 Tax=Allorhodopirellula solitaria TaxID=2527987 RepID=UPI001FEC8A2A|nr:four helix bundle protein [Allorhodopirellula solitaria]
MLSHVSDGARNRNQPLCPSKHLPPNDSTFSGWYRHARDQWLRAARSIPPNIAKGNDKRSQKGRARLLDIARRSALECANIQDVLLRTNGIKMKGDAARKAMHYRIVAGADSNGDVIRWCRGVRRGVSCWDRLRAPLR